MLESFDDGHSKRVNVTVVAGTWIYSYDLEQSNHLGLRRRATANIDDQKQKYQRANGRGFLLMHWDGAGDPFGGRKDN